MLPRQLTLPPHPPAKLTPSPSYSCSLFALFFALPSFRINYLQPLFAKYRGGVGIPNASTGRPGWGYLLHSRHLASGFQFARRSGSTRRGDPLSSEKERWRNCSSTNSFRINTCKSVSKQMPLTPFRMNTYEKQGGGGSPKRRYGPGTSLTEQTGRVRNTANKWQPLGGRTSMA
jgi:hypothetical protein